MDINETNKQEPKHKKPSALMKAVVVIASSVLIISICLLIIVLLIYKKEDDNNKEIEKEFVTENADVKNIIENGDETDTGDEELDNKKLQEGHTKMKVAKGDVTGRDMTVDDIAVDYDGLVSANSDYVCWIHVPIGISYPVVQGDTNDYYIHKNFYKKSAYSGAIMLSSYNTPDLTDRNSVIYGHNMANGTMFGLLHRFEDTDKLKDYPYFFIHVKGGYYTYEIFSMQKIYKKNTAFNTLFDGDEQFREYLDTCKAQSSYWKDGVVTEKDRIVTLSTCHGRQGTSNRLIIQGRLKCFTSYDGTRTTYEVMQAEQTTEGQEK